jgi:hypothetical protein
MNPNRPQPDGPAEQSNGGRQRKDRERDIEQPPVPPDRAPDVIPQEDPPRHREPPPMIT